MDVTRPSVQSMPVQERFLLLRSNVKLQASLPSHRGALVLAALPGACKGMLKRWVLSTVPLPCKFPS